MKLYEQTEAMIKVNAMMEEGYEGLEDTLEALEESFHTKVEGIIKLKQAKELHALAIKSEMDRLAAMKSKLDKDAQWLHNYVETEMKKLGLEEVKSNLFNIKLKTNPKRVEVLDESAIPSHFINTKVTLSVDKIAIKKAVELGEFVPGVDIVQDIKLSVK